MGFLKRLFSRRDQQPASDTEHEPNASPLLVMQETVVDDARAPDESQRPATSGTGTAERATSVTVTCEEHYQPTIEASMPLDRDADRGWPLLCDLALVPRNPHTKSAGSCIEVRIGDAPVGYLTPKMTERYRAHVQECADRGERAAAAATVRRGAKSGATIWRVTVHIA
jgi:hypothetical protein